MSKSMEITNLLVHISLLKQIIRNFEAMAKLSDDPTRREEYKQEAEEVRKEVSDYERRIQTLRGRANETD
jgi:FtsZ-binding cell division protein ZapB